MTFKGNLAIGTIKELANFLGNRVMSKDELVGFFPNCMESIKKW